MRRGGGLEELVELLGLRGRRGYNEDMVETPASLSEQRNPVELSKDLDSSVYHLNIADK